MGFGSKMCREEGMMGKESLLLSACQGAEAMGEKVESSLFYSLRVSYIEAAYID